MFLNYHFLLVSFYIKKEIKNKDSDRFEGPFTVIRRIHERSYELKNNQGKTLVRNVEWLRNFKERGMLGNVFLLLCLLY